MASGFIASGLMALAPALAVMLGANVGSTVIVQILTFNIGVVAPIFILAGVIAFKRAGTTRFRDLGRVSIGLASQFWRGGEHWLSARPRRPSGPIQRRGYADAAKNLPGGRPRQAPG